MDFLTWGRSPWSQDILLHISWDLFWVSLIGGLAFLVVHAIYVKVAPKHAHAPSPEERVRMAALERVLPERVKRHSLAARLFHWVMAAAMLTLLVTGFMPLVGIQFGWVTIHWIAGLALTASIVFHIIHASFWLDFWSIWVNKADMQDGWRRFQRSIGRQAPEPRKAGKYPVDNKMYHNAIIATGFAAVVTGLFMMVRIQTPFLTRNPYLFSDQTWGWMYVLHGAGGVALVGLTVAHIYFAIRPEKIWITKSMIFGSIGRREYLEHHDPQRWIVPTSPVPPPSESEQKKIAV
jgi:formate dehydrogenase subunit gamma